MLFEFIFLISSKQIIKNLAIKLVEGFKNKDRAVVELLNHYEFHILPLGRFQTSFEKQCYKIDFFFI